MSSDTPAGVLPYLRWLVGADNGDALSDAQLLERFLRSQDEAAFTALLRRHGPMVLGVCRRVLGDADDADDAFQATFLVLVKKANAIGKRDAVGSWLYKVAYRTALRARTATVRRRAEERKAAMPTNGTLPDPAWSDLRPLLDQELARLPDKYRAPLVLCYLDGKTKDEAARELGWPEGTVSGRLARARELLRQRLAGRGVALPTALLTSLLLENAASASVPAPLAMTTLQAAVLIAAGKTAAASALAAPAVALTEGVIHAMLVTKLKIAALILAGVAVLGTSAGALTYQAFAGDEPASGSGKGAAASRGGAGPAATTGAAGAPTISAGGGAAGIGDPSAQSKPAGQGAATDDTQEPKATLTNREVRRKLQAPAGLLTGIDPGTPLKDALEYISQKNGLSIRIDHNAFYRRGGGEDLPEDTQVQLKATAKGTTLGSALRDMLAQMQPPATFLVKGGQVVLVPYELYMNPDVGRDPSIDPIRISPLLREPVQVSADEMPLADALRELAEATGANIVVDARLKELAKTPVTAHLQHVPLETAVRLLADMADVKSVAIDNVLYVTTAENAGNLRDEEATRNNPNPPAGIGGGMMGVGGMGSMGMAGGPMGGPVGGGMGLGVPGGAAGIGAPPPGGGGGAPKGGGASKGGSAKGM